MVTPGGACVEHGGAWGSTRLAARVARAPPSAACAPRATARPDSPHFQNTPPRERASDERARSRSEGSGGSFVLSCARCSDARCRPEARPCARAPLALHPPLRARAARYPRHPRAADVPVCARAACVALPAVRAQCGVGGGTSRDPPFRRVRSLSSASRGRAHSKGTRKQGPPPRARCHVHVRVR